MRHVAGADYSIPAEPRELLRADEMLRANPPTTRWRCDQRAIWGRSRRFDRGSADGRYRRILPVSARPGKGPLTEPIAGVQPAARELVFMPEAVEKRVIRG
jgi:hypothetical protein